jgi:N-succinyldiaminopimelate aminotransferase
MPYTTRPKNFSVTRQFAVAMNPHLQKLQPYPFERLAAIRQSVTPPADLAPIDLSIGEPKHPTPKLIIDALQDNLADLAKYPLTLGSEALRFAIADWLTRRYGLDVGQLKTATQILPVNGTREALFALAQCLVDTGSGSPPLIVMPNPFYQIYEGAALLAGAEPWFLNCDAGNDYLADFDAVPSAVWQRCQLCYICTPGNPGGACLSLAHFERLLALAEQYDFVVASDECYAEIYTDETRPPLGLLQAATLLGRKDFARCIVFHSLSKRSSVPGLRSGFVAGDANIISQFLRYRTYHGCAMPLPTQVASIAAWRDEQHVQDNRRLYRDKFKAVIEILGPTMEVRQPAGGFYLWQPVPMDDVEFTSALFAQTNVVVLPGSFLARANREGINPGCGYVRIALVAPAADCQDAAHRMAAFIQSIQ